MAGGLNKPSDGVSVSCSDDSMRIDIAKDALNGMSIVDLHLVDSACQATSNSSHYTLETPLVGCGTASRHNEDYIIYSNEVIQTSSDSESIISRDPDLAIPFACFYGKEGVTSTYGLKPRHKVRSHVFVWNGSKLLKILKSGNKLKHLGGNYRG